MSAAKAPVRWRHGWELDSTPITYLVEGMIPLGWLGAIGGKDGRGKTLLGLELAKCVLPPGAKLFGEFVVRQGKVFAMLLDDPENLIRARLETLGILNHPDLMIATQHDVTMRDPAGMLAYLSAQLAKHQPTLILIDALYLFIPPGKTDQQNSAGAMMPVMVAFDEIATRTGATVAIVAHDNKAGADIAGSAAIRQMFKWIVRVILPKKFEDDPEGGRETTERVIQLNKLKTGRPTRWHLELLGVGEWVFQGDSGQHRVTSLRARIPEALAVLGEATVLELTAHLGAREDDVRKQCTALVQDARILQGTRPRADCKPGRHAVIYGLGPLRSGMGIDRAGDKDGIDRSSRKVPENKGIHEEANLSIPIHAGRAKAINPGFARGPKLLSIPEPVRPGSAKRALTCPECQATVAHLGFRAHMAGHLAPERYTSYGPEGDP